MIDLCYNCFDPSPTLKSLFRENGTLGNCPTCGKKRTRLLTTDDLEPLFEPLRKLYEVAEPGEHYVYDSETGDYLFAQGNDDLEQHLQGEWQLFSEKLDSDTIRRIIRCVWSSWDETSEYTYQKLWYRHADEIWDALSKRLKHERRFFMKRGGYDAEDIDVESQLAVYIDNSPTCELDQPLYRAQKNLKWKMRAPNPTEVKRCGRANPAGIAYLYLASDQETALAEVRAEPGERLRVGKFQLAADASFIDLRQTDRHGIDPFAYADLKFEINRRRIFRMFAEMLSRPVADKMRELDYVPTQYLAELIAHKGLDGILFRSSLAKGFNLVTFDPQNAKCLGTHIVEVTAKKYEFHIENGPPTRQQGVCE